MATVNISRKQQEIKNRHITQDAAMFAPDIDALFEAHRLLLNYLSVEENIELNRQMNCDRRQQRRVLEHWYNMVEARERVLVVDAAVREARINRQPQPLAERVSAVAAAKALGMTVEQELWTCDVSAVRIV